LRKDYLPDDGSGRDSDEAAFVERYWTAQWHNRQTPAASSVERSEEYRLMQPHLARMAPGSRILDGGCGLGQWTKFLSDRGFNVVGVDISHETIGRLQTLFPTLTFVREDLRATSFAAGSFDAYFSWGTFEHFEAGLGACIAEAARVLRSGGLLFASVPFQNWRLILRDARALERWDEHFDPARGYATALRFYQWRLTRPEFRRELEGHGFKVHAVRPIGKLTGAGRMLQWDLPIFAKGTRGYTIARRGLATVLPAAFISHMIFAVAERR
jgi:SAM-dependent methyltransferase